MRRMTVAWMMPLVMARLQAGMTQGQVADRLGVSPATISNLESGTRNTLQSTIAGYADLFDMKMNIVFTGIPKEVMAAIEPDVIFNND